MCKVARGCFPTVTYCRFLFVKTVQHRWKKKTQIIKVLCFLTLCSNLHMDTRLVSTQRFDSTSIFTKQALQFYSNRQCKNLCISIYQLYSCCCFLIHILSFITKLLHSHYMQSIPTLHRNVPMKRCMYCIHTHTDTKAHMYAPPPWLPSTALRPPQCPPCLRNVGMIALIL